MTTSRRQSLPWPELVLFVSITLACGGFVLTMLFFGPWGREIPAFAPHVLRLDIFAAAAERLGLWGTFAAFSGFCLLLACVATLMKNRR